MSSGPTKARHGAGRGAALGRVRVAQRTLGAHELVVADQPYDATTGLGREALQSS